MPTKAYFDQYPPFPTDVPTAQLPRISVAKLLVKDENESEALFQSSRELGFFLLNFNDSIEGKKFLQKAETMFDITEGVNALDQDELERYAYKPPSSLFGYKKLGGIKIEDGRPDRIEFYNVGRDDMLGVGERLENPAYIEKYRAVLRADLRALG